MAIGDVNRILRNLTAARKRIVASGLRGTHKAGIRLKALAIPITPVDEGLLWQRFVVTTDMLGNDPVSVLANTVSYAPFVHENLEARHKPGKSAKFITKPADENRGELREIIEREMRIP